MSAPRIGKQGARDTVNDFRLIEPGLEYEQLIVQGLAESDAVSSLVCNGAIPMDIDATAEPNDKLIGRGLISSYVTGAYNAATNAYPGEFKAIEHCMFRTTGSHGFVMDYEDRVWDIDCAGAYMTLVCGEDKRNSVLDTTDQVLSETNDAKPIQKALLDALFLPLVQAWPGNDLNCEVLMYLDLTFRELMKHISHEDFIVVKEAIRGVTELDDAFASNLFGAIAVLMGMPIPTYMPREGDAWQFARILRSCDWSDVLQMGCLTHKLMIEMVNDIKRSGLLIANFLDMHLTWGGQNNELEVFAERMEEHPHLPQPVDLSSISHRAVTRDKIWGVNSLSEEMELNGGKLIPAEFGEVSTADLQGRKVGTVDGRRAVAFFENGEIIVQFKNIRNYFLNVLYYARASHMMKTEVREQVVDRDRLVGLPALYLLLRGRTNVSLARFTVAALTCKAISMQRNGDTGLSSILGIENGQYAFEGMVSPAILKAFPVLIDEHKQLFLFHNEKTYRLRRKAMSWFAKQEDTVNSVEAFGILATPLPLKEGWPS